MSKHVQPFHDRFHDRLRRAAQTRAENLDDGLAERRAERLAESCVDEPTGPFAFVKRLFSRPAAALARERAFVAQLPFTLEGWEDVLGDNHKHCGVLGLHFEPEPVTAQREIIEQLVHANHGDWQYVADDASFQRTGFRENRQLRVALHAVAATALPAIAKAHGITKIIVYNRRAR